MKKDLTHLLIKFFSRSETPVFIFLLFLIIIISFFTPNFLTIGNLKGILEQVVVISIIALAVNQVIYSAEIDISTGSLLAVCAFVYGFVAMATGGSWLALLASLLCGFTVGLFNGFFLHSFYISMSISIFEHFQLSLCFLSLYIIPSQDC